MRIFTRSLAVATIAALLYFGWLFTSRHLADRRLERARQPQQAAPFEDIRGNDTTVRILHFYAGPGTLTEGDKAILCYGVANARSVAVSPPIGPISPSFNRCLEIAPEQDTRYTLTATGADGRTVSESFLIQVKPVPALLPKIRYFAPAKKIVEGGKTTYSLCYAVENAELVSVDPPVIPPMAGAPNGCFYVAPSLTTTYTLTVEGPKGRTAQKQLTIRVPDAGGLPR